MIASEGIDKEHVREEYEKRVCERLNYVTLTYMGEIKAKVGKGGARLRLSEVVVIVFESFWHK